VVPNVPETHAVVFELHYPDGEPAEMLESDWTEIEELRHRIWLRRHEFAFEEFFAQTRRLIAEKISG
jgi:hypothetical protein